MGSILLSIIQQEATGFSISAEMIVAIGAILTAIFTFISSKTAERRTAKKDEVDLLREEVERLQDRVSALTLENDSWRKRYEVLYNYVLVLRKVMVDSNIAVPSIPYGVMYMEREKREEEEKK